MRFTEDATYYSEQVKQKKISAVELVQQAITNIKQLDKEINSVVHVQEEYAFKRAEELDQQLKQTQIEDIENLPPFFGVPILLKDLGQNQESQPSTSGSKLLKDSIATRSDQFVNDIIQAGFVIIGRTNVPEFGFKGISDSAHYGRVNFPLDSSRNPGGSSGGAAAAIKAGIVPIATASDGGGSIRMPASYNGLIGLKPSRGRIAVGPNRYRGWQGAAVDFAITKSIRDTWRLLKAVQKEQYDSPFLMPLIDKEHLDKLDRPLKIAYSTVSPIKEPVKDEAKKVVEQTVIALKELGHEVVEDTPNIDGIEALTSYYLVNGVETAAMFDGFKAKLDLEIKPEDVEPLSWAFSRFGQDIPAKDYSKLLALWDQMAAKMEAFFKEYDMLLLPTTNGPAPPHEEFAPTKKEEEQMLKLEELSKEEQFRFLWNFFKRSHSWTPFTQQQNLTGQPAISLPLYETKEGLPIGSQFWSGKGKEYLLLQIGSQLEEQGLLNVSLADTGLTIGDAY